jgi:hypothetical protein
MTRTNREMVQIFWDFVLQSLALPLASPAVLLSLGIFSHSAPYSPAFSILFYRNGHRIVLPWVAWDSCFPTSVSVTFLFTPPEFPLVVVLMFCSPFHRGFLLLYTRGEAKLRVIKQSSQGCLFCPLSSSLLLFALMCHVLFTLPWISS